jgi:hypothetical protein
MADSAARVMREDDWISLVRSVEHGNCILMIGPDAVLGTFDGDRLPLDIGLARYVKQRLGPGHAYLDPSNPSAIAQAAIDQEDPHTLHGWVREFYDNLDSAFSVLADVAAMPFRLVVNTEPLLRLDSTFSSVKPRANFEFYHRRDRAKPNLPDDSVEAPLVYNLYGSLDDPDSLILSDTDRLDFLVSVISGKPALPLKLTSALRDENRTFLFLGFRLHQWQLRILLHVLAADSRRKFKSFALELDQTELSSETKLFYQTGHKIHFCQTSVDVFIAELRRRVSEQPTPAARDSPGVAQLPPEAPVVFLCHAHEDKDFAERIAADLRRNGIGTWLDKENLRGGARWDVEIKRALRNDVQYVVVLQSAALSRKYEGYVNMELSLALDRQREYRGKRSFIIPVVIDSPDNKLDDLDFLQTIDLSEVEGVKNLVQAINRDLSWKAREK